MKTTMTKSLHTVTAVKNVARYIVKTEKKSSPVTALSVTLADAALTVLGYGDAIKARHTDETVKRCVWACEDVLAELQQPKQK